MSKMDRLRILAKNVALLTTDSISTATLTGNGEYALSNVVSSSLRIWHEFKEFSKLSNDALYSMQIDTFFETADLDPKEVDKFLNENADGLRLGIETLKILEKTHLTIQAELIAINFKKYLTKVISIEQHNLYNHIITQLDRHTVFTINHDIKVLFEESMDGLNYFDMKEEDKEDLDYFFTKTNLKTNIPSLSKLGLLEEEVEVKKITATDISKLTAKYGSITIEPKTKYKRTKLYKDFFLDIYSQGKWHTQ